MRIAVLGAGITGITCTHLLHEKGHEVVCLEAAPRPGGLCGSETIDGFVADRAGGHIIFSKDQEVLDFSLRAVEFVGHHTCQRQTFIYYKGHYVQYPFENGIGDLPLKDRAECLEDYVEASFARRSGAMKPDNFHDWCLWRFGEAMCRQFMHPYNEKIWNIPLDELGIAWVDGRVPDAPLGDVLRSAIGVRTEGYRHQAIFHYPLTGGFESLVKGVARWIPEGVVRCSNPCESLERQPDGSFLVNGERFDRVISTLPLQELRKVLSDVPAEVDGAFGALDFTSLLSIFIALDKKDAPDHSWLYFPHEEDGPANRVTWLSNYSPQNAPPGKSSVMAEVTYYRELGRSPEAAIEEVIAGLSKAGLFDRDQVLFTKAWDSRYAYILFRKDLEQRLELVRSWCEAKKLDIVGRFGNYNYFNSDLCIRAAMDLAESIGPAR